MATIFLETDNGFLINADRIKSITPIVHDKWWRTVHLKDGVDYEVAKSEIEIFLTKLAPTIPARDGFFILEPHGSGDAIDGYQALPVLAWRVDFDGILRPITCDEVLGDYAVLVPSGKVIRPADRYFDDAQEWLDHLRAEKKREREIEAAREARALETQKSPALRP